VLLEASPPPQPKPVGVATAFSNRVSALNLSSVGLLTDLGCWGDRVQGRAQAVHKMQVWDSCSSSSITFDTPDDGPLNHIVENDLIVESLTQEMEKCPNLEVRYGAKVQEYTIPQHKSDESVPKENVVISLSDQTKLETNLLVGADGLRSLVRASLGLSGEYMSWEYPQMGLVASLQLDDSIKPNHTAWQRFLPTGPVALLPLAPGYSSLVWSLPKSEVGALLKMDELHFVDILNQALTSQQAQNPVVNTIVAGLENILSSIPGMENTIMETPPLVKSVSSRAAFPLGFGHSPTYRGVKTVLIGDAAHRVHPLAGLGANLGLGDVKELVKQVELCDLNGESIGHASYLARYETERLRHNVPVMLGIDGLQKLYSSDTSPLVLARAVGLTATSMYRPLVKRIQSMAAA